MNIIEQLIQIAGTPPDAYWARRLLEIQAFDDPDRNAELLIIVLNKDPLLLVSAGIMASSAMGLSNFLPCTIEKIVADLDIAEPYLRAANAGLLWASVGSPPTAHRDVARREAVPLLLEALHGGVTTDAVLSASMSLFGEVPDPITLAAGLRLLHLVSESSQAFSIVALMPAAVALKDWESYTQLRSAYDVAQRAYPYKSPDCEVVVANFDGAFALTRADSDAVADAVDRLKRFGKNVPYLNRAEGLIFVEGLIDAEVHLESCLEYLSSFALEFRTAPIEKLITKIKVLQHAINRRDAVSVPSKLPRSERQPT